MEGKLAVKGVAEILEIYSLYSFLLQVDSEAWDSVGGLALSYEARQFR